MEIEREIAHKIITLAEMTMDVSNSDFDWDAMRGLLDYYSDVRNDALGKVLILAETGRKLHREKSGDKSGLSIIGGGSIRETVLDGQRRDIALILLQQEGSRELGWSGQRFWWPMLATPNSAEPCVFATKVMS